MSCASVAMSPPVYAKRLAEVRKPFEQAGLRTPRMPFPAREQGGGGGNSGAHSGAKVGGDAALDRPGAAVGVEAVDVEPPALGALPQLRVLEPSLVGEERVVHGPEGALRARRLRGGGGGPRARVARADGEVAERHAQRQPPQAVLERRAERALEVRVDDDERRVLRAADVVLGREGRQRCRAEAAQTAAASRASKIRLAPGRSPGEGAS